MSCHVPTKNDCIITSGINRGYSFNQLFNDTIQWSLFAINKFFGNLASVSECNVVQISSFFYRYLRRSDFHVFPAFENFRHFRLRLSDFQAIQTHTFSGLLDFQDFLELQNQTFKPFRLRFSGFSDSQTSRPFRLKFPGLLDFRPARL